MNAGELTKQFGLIDFDALTMAEVEKRMCTIRNWKQAAIATVKKTLAARKSPLPYKVIGA